MWKCAGATRLQYGNVQVRNISRSDHTRFLAAELLFRRPCPPGRRWRLLSKRQIADKQLSCTCRAAAFVQDEERARENTQFRAGPRNHTTPTILELRNCDILDAPTRTQDAGNRRARVAPTLHACPGLAMNHQVGRYLCGIKCNRREQCVGIYVRNTKAAVQ